MQVGSYVHKPVLPLIMTGEVAESGCFLNVKKMSTDQNTKMDTHSFLSILSNDLGEAGSQSKYMSGKGIMKEVSEHYQPNYV